MKKRNLQPSQTAPVERPQAGSANSPSRREPLAIYAAGWGGVCASFTVFRDRGNPFAGDDAE